MSPRSLAIVLPAIFAVSLGLGYGLSPRSEQPQRSTPTTSTPAPTPIEAPAVDTVQPGIPEAESGATTITEKRDTPGTAEDVFNALGGTLFSERAFQVQQAINRLDATQLEVLLEQIDSVGRFDQAQILPRVIDRLMDLDPLQSWAWLETNAPSFREGSSTFTLAFEMAWKKDPDGGRRFFDSLPDGDRRNGVGEVMIKNMAMKDPRAAYAFLQTFPNGATRDKLALSYVHGLATSNPESAISQALKWRGGATREATLTTAFLALARAGQGKALDALDQVKGDRERGEILSRLAARARENDLPSLAAYYQSALQNQPGIAESFDGIERLADGFARTDPAEAIKWAKSLSGEQSSKALTTTLSVWGWDHPEEAIEWVQKNSTTAEERQKHLETIYHGWLRTDLPKAQAWAEKLQPGPERDRATELIVSQYATKGEHREAIEWLQRLPAKQQGDLAMQIAGRLAWDNPAVASRWLGNIEPDENSAQLFSRVASEWAEKDFKAAANWMETIPAGVCRDRAVAVYASKVAQLDPAGAVEWAASASNELVRVNMVAHVLSEWRERDPKAAEQWLDRTAALSAERKAALKSNLR